MEPQEKYVLDFFHYLKMVNYPIEPLFFVDIGANDGITLSNTIHLEKEYGWQGICIEPNPDAYSKLAKNRSCKCYNYAMYSEEKDIEFLKITGYSEMLSGINESYDNRHKDRLDKEVTSMNQKIEVIKMKTKTLNALLQNVEKISFLTIDTEGSELPILKGINLNKYKVDLIAVEDNFDENVCDEYLKDYGYKKINRVKLDNFYSKL